MSTSRKRLSRRRAQSSGDGAAPALSLLDLSEPLPAPGERTPELQVLNLPKRKVIAGEKYSTTAVVTRRSVSSYILANDEERYDTPTGVAVRHMEGQIVAEVELRASQSAPDHSAIRQVASKLGGLDEDVLDICIANALQNGPDADGSFYLDIDSIIAARDRGAKRKKDGTAVYASGAQAWAREAIESSVKALDQLYISYEPNTRVLKGKNVREYNRVFYISKKILEEETGRMVAFSYHFGKWWENWNDNIVLAPQALLALDARNEESLKALGRFFTHLLPEQNEQGEVVRKVRDVLLTIRRSLHIGKNPQRLRDWLEHKLERLCREGVILEWHYGPQELVDELPAYKWLEPWLELSVVVKPFRAQLALPERISS